jgi:PilZ domain
MQERRLCPRKRVLKSGLIVRSGNGPTIECAVRNVSDSGACLQISVAYDLSMDFAFFMGGSHRSGRVVWRSKDRSGIAYT